MAEWDADRSLYLVKKKGKKEIETDLAIIVCVVCYFKQAFKDDFRQ